MVRGNDRSEPKLTAKQQSLIVAMLTYSSPVEAARAAGVPEPTARRWLAQEDFTQPNKNAPQKPWMLYSQVEPSPSRRFTNT